MARPIIETLRHLQGGCLLDSAATDLAEVVKGVEATGKAGKLVITIDVRKATAGAMAIKGTCKSTIPQEPITEALMFPTPEGALLTEDPNQRKLDLQPVPVPATELRTVTGS